MNEESSIRIGDREREEAVARLGAHYEAGRLSAEEHQERVGEALQGKTQADLAALFADLPGEKAADEKQQWAGPWGQPRPPWTAPRDQRRAGRAGEGSFGRVPLPALIALVVAGVVASVACVVLGGHPPVLPMVLLVAGLVIASKRRQGRRA